MITPHAYSYINYPIIIIIHMHIHTHDKVIGHTSLRMSIILTIREGKFVSVVAIT